MENRRFSLFERRNDREELNPYSGGFAMMPGGRTHSSASRVVVLSAFWFLFLSCIEPVPASAFYITSSIWYTANTIYGRSEIYLNLGEFAPSNFASVACSLSSGPPYYYGSQGSDCNTDSASATVSYDRIRGSWTVNGLHVADSYESNCLGGLVIGRTYAYLTIEDPVINYFYASPERETPPGTVTPYYGTANGTSAT